MEKKCTYAVSKQCLLRYQWITDRTQAAGEDQQTQHFLDEASYKLYIKVSFIENWVFYIYAFSKTCAEGNCQS